MPMANNSEHLKHIKSSSEKDSLNSQVKDVPRQEMQFSYEALQESAQYLLDRTSIRPRLGIISGSGLGAIAEMLTQQQIFPYDEIPHFPVTTVQGHTGQMIFGYLDGLPVMFMQGRFHFYEGYPLWKCSMPVKVMKLIGATHLIVTNAAGGINPDYNVGDIMIIKDHVNMMGFAGNSSLQGPNDERFGPRFPAMSRAYDKKLLSIADKVVADMNIQKIARKGVYTCVGGPEYGTTADAKILKLFGIDAVGMSTVHEVMTACHCDMTVFAFSLITDVVPLDYCNDNDGVVVSHQEVLNVAKSMEVTFKEFVSRMVAHIKVILDDNSK